jgi:pimeloyl-ACP methyl ester carboxylesterase
LVNCNAPHPWARVSASLVLDSWRSWYMLVNASPLIGHRVNASGWMPRWVLTHGHVNSPFSEEEVEDYLERLRDPARAGAVVALYRYYQRTLREGARGRWRSERLTVPTLILFGERDLYITPKLVDPDAAARHADDIRVELVPDSGHFIVGEKPELVIERAREFLRRD